MAPRHRLTGSALLAAAVAIAASAGAARAGVGPTTAPTGAPEQHPPVDARTIYQHFPVVELVTMGVGDLIWERHGHIALCVRYRQPFRDRCYNYGTADFAHPLSMAWGFFRASDSFWVSATTPRRMLAEYRYTDRTIWVQPLPLTDAQEQQVIAKLESDLKEENRYYSYDHFWDNCTTRVRDILDDAAGGALSRMSGPVDHRTYRDLAREGFYGMRIPLLATDIAMGRATDRVPTYYERMFLPATLRQAVTRLWGIQPVVAYQRRGPPPPANGPSGRVLLALAILALTSPAWLTRRWGRFERLGTLVAIAPYLVLGSLLWLLAVVSPLSYVRWNETLLVFLPLDLLLVVAPGPLRRRYARGRLVMLAVVALLLAVGILEQPLWPELLWPLVPAAVVGLWPARARATADDLAGSASAAPAAGAS